MKDSILEELIPLIVSFFLFFGNVFVIGEEINFISKKKYAPVKEFYITSSGNGNCSLIGKYYNEYRNKIYEIEIKKIRFDICLQFENVSDIQIVYSKTSHKRNVYLKGYNEPKLESIKSIFVFLMIIISGLF
jgi:hypothetical protein